MSIENNNASNESGGKAGLFITIAGFIFFVLLLFASLLYPSPVNTSDISLDYSSYVDLGNYKNINVSSIRTTVSDEDVDAKVSAIIDSFGGYYEDDVVGIVDDGDQVEALYCLASSVSDAFDEASAQGITINVGGGDLPEEFVTPLIGHSVGEDISVIMSDGTIYLVRIDQIHQKGEIDDDYIASLGIEDVSTVEELYDNTRKYLENEALSNFKGAAREELVASCYNNALFKEMPKELVEPFKEVLRARLDNAISASSLQGEDKTYDDILADTYEKDGISSVEEYLDIYGLQNARIYAMCEKISESESLKVADIDIYSLAASDWLNVRDEYSSFKDFAESSGLEIYRQAALLEVVKDYLYEINVGE